MNDFGTMSWNMELGGRLWHAVQKDKHTSLCGKRLTSPRMVMDAGAPEDEARCAKCDRVVVG